MPYIIIVKGNADKQKKQILMDIEIQIERFMENMMRQNLQCQKYLIKIIVQIENRCIPK